MKRNTVRLIQAAAFLAVFTGVAGAELVRNPTRVGGNFDFGQLVEGSVYNGSTAPNEKTENQMITRTGVYLTESGVYNDRLTIQLTIGGLFWYSLPESYSFQSRRIQFGPGVGEAQGVYAFGSDPKNPAATLQFGLFGHKYSESVNLGEYLYRSGTYPGTLWSGGWSYMNAAAYMAQGARLTVPVLGGKVINDFTLYMERDLEPTNDLSPGYMVTARPTTGVELGAGVVWSHAISLNSKRLAPKDVEENKYSKSTDKPTTVDATSPCATGTTSDCGYYTFRGFKTNARASLDIGTLAGLDMIPAGDLKIYSEVAILGVENQPYYYEKLVNRMPVMVGLNVPTFGLLQRLTFEGEYQRTRFPNNVSFLISKELPVPVSDANGTNYLEDKDNWKWTVYAKRSILPGVDLYAQAASDHLRHFNDKAEPGGRPATTSPTDWYYVLRLQFGI